MSYEKVDISDKKITNLHPSGNKFISWAKRNGKYTIANIVMFGSAVIGFNEGKNLINEDENVSGKGLLALSIAGATAMIMASDPTKENGTFSSKEFMNCVRKGFGGNSH
ncbi:MAG: hypothetical protein IJ660_02255 [Alphaproteobacteria bacterium]|nr:hypothetical protein [Alphaproteobacteria bacterium]